MQIRTSSPAAARHSLLQHWRPWALPVLFVAGWFLLYGQLEPATDAAMRRLAAATAMAPDSHLYSALGFFLFEVPKVLMLLALIVFIVGVVQTFFTPEKTRALLSGRRQGVGNAMASALGIVTPFCSCSAVPMFLGFVSAGVPLGVTFSFLIASPMINEVALGLLFALVGWQVALTYLLFGLAVAIVAGWVIGRLHLDGWLEPWVRELRSAPVTALASRLSLADRIEAGIEALRDIFGRVWIWLILGIAAGAFIHGFVPAGMLSSIMGARHWWAVPAAVLIGVPIYSNAAGIIPVVTALLGKGAALGTVLAFMMAVTALSAPETIILRKVLSLRLIAVFVGVVTLGIIAVGYLFNALFA